MAGIRNSDRIYIEELAGNQPRNLMVLCERLFLEFHADSTPQEMAGQIARKLQEEPMLIGEMLKRRGSGSVICTMADRRGCDPAGTAPGRAAAASLFRVCISG